jgi:uncharacterized protein (TIGR02466 family)
MLNRDVELITIVKIDVLKGKSFVDLNTLKEIILKESDNKLSNQPYCTRYEDTYCPPHPIIDDIIDEMIIDFKAATGEDIKCDEYWGHIHEKNMSTNTHDHGNAYVSSVLYISSPEGSGDLVFIPRTNPYDNRAYLSSFKPMAGYYYLFPSYIDHYVTRNKSEEKRISISFNFEKV